MNIKTQNLSWSFPLCPSPGEKIRWHELEKLAWMLPMDGCLQDSQHHAEGDVLQHTKLVCEALVASDSWQKLDVGARNALFAACLLHDVAKPATSKTDEAGHISSMKHTRAGTSMAREILWRNAEFAFPSFYYREQIAKLVRFSGLPLWFFEKEDPVKAVLRASMSVRLDWLAVLAEADVNGRECSDKGDLESRVSMFKEFCIENKCFEQPREFASPHSRYTYFHTESRYPEREAYDDTKSKVTILSGLPGSGKNKWLRENAGNTPIISLDAIREVLDIEPEDSQGAVIARARQDAQVFLRKGEPFIWNATNVSSTLRSSLISFMEPYKASFRIVYIEAPTYAELKRRNSDRDKSVPEKVLMKLLGRLEVPDLSEAHELIVHID